MKKPIGHTKSCVDSMKSGCRGGCNRAEKPSPIQDDFDKAIKSMPKGVWVSREIVTRALYLGGAKWMNEQIAKRMTNKVNARSVREMVRGLK